MPERYQWQSALATLGIEAQARAPAAHAGVVLCERQAGTQLVIRGDGSEGGFSAAVSQTLGLELPVTPKTAHRRRARTLLWLGPDEWLAVMAADNDGKLSAGLVAALADVSHAVVDVSHSRAVIGLQGSNAREVLLKGTNLDLHPRAFGPDNCIQARLGRCHMLLHQLDDGPSYDIYVHRSFAVYAWNWLCDAASEYGLSVRGA
ncbi:MAG: sarcosine oxidase subunit gamma family protein [Gammaproteobacteria bacterium]|nr:MAG: sarcosine oxidase subunit gamma family protein [Gammaproteobacteria bacterium]